MEPAEARPYLFIAYKPDSQDTCRGCLMASYGSDFEINNNLSREETIKVLSEYLHKNLNRKNGEAPYVFYIFRDGQMIWNETYVSWDGHDKVGYESLNFEDAEKIEKEISVDANLIFEEANKRAVESRAKQKQEAQRLLNEKRLQLETENKKARRREFERLKKEFENQ